MNFYRTLSPWKVFNSIKCHAKTEHRIYSSVCVNTHTNLFSKNVDTFDYPRNLRSVTTRSAERSSDEGFFKSILNKVGWLDVSKAKLKFRGFLLYENVVDKLNYAQFFQECQLPDTFYSWFVITELHIWMISVRCMAEGPNGRYLRNSVIEALWTDVSERSKKLAPGSGKLVKEQIHLFGEQFQAALVSYDEGLMSSDIILAGAVWRRIFQLESDDPILIENIVKYIRKQILLLENIPASEFMENLKIDWIPLLDNKKSVQ